MCIILTCVQLLNVQEPILCVCKKVCMCVCVFVAVFAECASFSRVCNCSMYKRKISYVTCPHTTVTLHMRQEYYNIPGVLLSLIVLSTDSVETMHNVLLIIPSYLKPLL